MTASMPSSPSPPALPTLSTLLMKLDIMFKAACSSILTVSNRSKSDHAIDIMNLPPFLRLPAELRNRIYELVLCSGKRIHIRQLVQELPGLRSQTRVWCQDPACCGRLYSSSDAAAYSLTRTAICSIPELTAKTVVLHRSSEAKEETTSLRPQPPWQYSSAPTGHYFCIKEKLSLALPFLRTCRQIYEEGSSVLYEGNTFSFTSPREVKQFARHVLFEKQLVTIKKIHLSGVAVVDNKTVESVLKEFPGWETVEVEYK